MKFTNQGSTITTRDIEHVENSLGLKLPRAVHKLYLFANGGSPKPYVFENDSIDTVVSGLLPLKAQKGTAIVAYKKLVLNKKLVPQQFFPFAVDGGGDYFFVDCSTIDGTVYFFRGDSASAERLISLAVGFDQFWSLLKDE